jgi:hypothetical protein
LFAANTSWFIEIKIIPKRRIITMGNELKEFTTIIMDGSDRKVVNRIVDTFQTMVVGEVTCGPLDEAHPTMMVVRASTTASIYGILQWGIANVYPGLCVFDQAA